MDMSDFFKNHLAKLHKATNIGKNVQQTRKDDLKRDRQSKRDTMAFARRNIDLVNMSPYSTPVLVQQGPLRNNNRADTTKKYNSKSSADVVSKRLEMLAKWKAEKAKQKQVEKDSKKPVFKVCHITTDNAGNSENVNKLIKGKAILASAMKKSQFAPANHKFNPPSGIKPLNFNNSSTQNNGFDFVAANLKKKPQKTAATPKIAISKPRISHNDKDVVFNKTPKKASSATNDRQLAKGKAGSQVKPKVTPSLSQSSSTSSISSMISKTKTRLSTSTPKLSVLSSNRNKPPVSSISKSSTYTPKPSVTSIRNKQTLSSARTSTSTPKPSVTSTAKNKQTSSSTRTSGTTPNPFVASIVKNGKPTSTISTRGDTTKKSASSVVKSKQTSSSKNTSTTTPKPSVMAVGKNKAGSKTANKKQVESKNINKKTPETSINESKKSPNTSAKKEQQIERTPTPSKAPVQLNANGDGNKSMNLVNEDFSDSSKTPIYISPFVTISRGKRNAREEFKVRRSLGIENPKPLTPEVANLLSVHTGSEAGAEYFMVKLDTEIDRLNKVCETWDNYLQDPELIEEARSSIDVAIGQSRLLMAKKFEQFRGLIVQCKTKQYEEKVITCEDLHGFWDMIYMQVEDLDKRFENLDRMRQSKWDELLPEQKEPVKKSPAKKTRARAKKAGGGGTSKLKDMIRAAREKKKVESERNVLGVDEKRFSGGYFEVRTPVKVQVPENVVTPASSKRKSLRVSLLTIESKKNRCSSSPGLTMMKVTQSIKQNNGLTPAKSILKMDGCKSTGKKSVAFKDSSLSPKPLRKTLLFNEERNEIASNKSTSFSEEEKENTPNSLRRSSRLNR